MQQLSVLIIDDSEIERYLLNHQLQKIGVRRVVQQADGIDGIAFLQDYANNKQQFGDDFPPDIIILDVNMPLMGGFAFLQQFDELRTQLDLDCCHILMYSGSDDPSEKKQAMQYEFVKGFLVKGESSTEELKATIHGL